MPRRPRDPGVPSSPIEYFGAELRTYREAADLTRPQLGDKLGYSPQWVGQVEAGQSGPSEDFAKDCDTYFKTNGTFHRLWKWNQRLVRLAALPPGFPDFVEREAQADVMHIFETMVVTGLFQTPEYAYEVLRSGKAPEAVEQLVATRMERQAILEGETPPHIVAIFDEGAIRRPVGNTDVMAGQVRHLINLAELPHITLQIVPTSKGAYAGVAGAFTVLSFPDDLDVVHIGGHVGAQIIDHPEAARGYAVRFDLIRGAALSADDSVSMLHAILESL
ncbi:helix-turn-helix domain-containing protein [Actinomadura terrae]|uniref:helix-turn-helix domain-containing protein n=1 Tax=Actinomadura terrae TaxID=604353 RepID=UPI001FA7AC78|nr:helix-turn-helix transcriptional regulator [Actinomadura terrae]